MLAYWLHRHGFRSVVVERTARLRHGTGGDAVDPFGPERSPARRFGLVVGADGLHSGVRRLVFGAEERFTHHLGGHLAVFTVPDHRGHDGRMVTVRAPDRLVVLYLVRGTGAARAVFLFRHDGLAPHHATSPGRRRCCGTCPPEWAGTSPAAR